MATRTASMGESDVLESAPEQDVPVEDPESEDEVEIPVPSDEASPEGQEEENEDDEEFPPWDTRTMDPDSELWPGGPTIAFVNELKDAHGRVYTAEFMEEMFIWRTLTRFEYRRFTIDMERAVSSGQLSPAQANLDLEESITEACVLYPGYSRAENAKSMAGLATAISQLVMEASAFTPTDVREL